MDKHVHIAPLLLIMFCAFRDTRYSAGVFDIGLVRTFPTESCK